MTGTEGDSLADVNRSARHPSQTQAPASQIPRPQRPRSKSRANRSGQLTAARSSAYVRATAQPQLLPRPPERGWAGRFRAAAAGLTWESGLPAAVPGWVGFHASASVPAEPRPPPVTVTAAIPNVFPLQVSARQNFCLVPTQAAAFEVLFRQPRFLSSTPTSSTSADSHFPCGPFQVNSMHVPGAFTVH